LNVAKIYLNEKEVGEVFGEIIGKDIQREELFIVGKVLQFLYQKIFLSI